MMQKIDISEIERTILATFLYADGLPTSDFEKLLSYNLDYSLFRSNITIKSTAKAISMLQEQGHPIDETVVKYFLDKRMAVDYDEYSKIICKCGVPYVPLMAYIEILKKEKKETERRKSSANI